MEFTGERVVPFAPKMRDWVWVLQHHLQRYTWALWHASGKTVVDLGCGTGYGSLLLSFVAESVLGVELDRDAFNFAQSHWSPTHFGNLRFKQLNLDDLRQDIPHAQIYTCFEVLEHLDKPLALIDRLPEGSTLLWSLPINDGNQYHKHVFPTAQDAMKFMAGSIFYYQMDDGTIRETAVNVQPKYLIGIMPL